MAYPAWDSRRFASAWSCLSIRLASASVNSPYIAPEGAHVPFPPETTREISSLSMLRASACRTHRSFSGPCRACEI